MTELLLGCGYSREKRAKIPGSSLEWNHLVTLDNNPDCKPDLICDLDNRHWLCRPRTSHGEKSVLDRYSEGNSTYRKIIENYFDEVHAYEVLEHLGQQGDITSFFHTFDNLYRILRNGGHLFATCPSRYSAWLWGDPGHRRAIQPESLIFLDQSSYNFQIGKTMMSDYRDLWEGDFKTVSSTDDKQFHRFVLQAIKPARNTYDSK